MKAIMVMFDWLNRRLLPPYGCDWVHAPNFARLARAHRRPSTTATSAACRACRPGARLHTGRYNFLHRSWGPLEPFDDSMPQILARARRLHPPGHRPLPLLGGRRRHLPQALQHLGDRPRPGGRPVEGQSACARRSRAHRRRRTRQSRRQDWVNRTYMRDEADQPQTRVFDAGWSSSGPTPGGTTGSSRSRPSTRTSRSSPSEKYKDLLRRRLHGPAIRLAAVPARDETPEEVAARPLRVCRAPLDVRRSLGRVLDLIDELDLWNDTMRSWAPTTASSSASTAGGRRWSSPSTTRMPTRRCSSGTRAARRRDSDARRWSRRSTSPPTLLEYFGVSRPPDMQGVRCGRPSSTTARPRRRALRAFRRPRQRHRRAVRLHARAEEPEQSAAVRTHADADAYEIAVHAGGIEEG